MLTEIYQGLAKVRRNRRGFLGFTVGAGLSVAGIAILIDGGENADKEEPELIGVAKGYIAIRIISPSGEELKLYRERNLLEQNVIEIDGKDISVSLSSMLVRYPEIYQGGDGRKWMKLRKFINNKGRKAHAYVPIEESSQMESLGGKMDELRFLEKKDGHYLDPMRPHPFTSLPFRKLDPNSIGMIEKLTQDQIERYRLFEYK